MTNEEKSMLITYLGNAGEIDPDGDLEEQFIDWYRCREGTVSGEIYYRAVLEAARIRQRSFEEGRRAGLGRGRCQVGGWDQLETSPGIHRFMDHVR